MQGIRKVKVVVFRVVLGLLSSRMKGDEKLEVKSIVDEICVSMQVSEAVGDLLRLPVIDIIFFVPLENTGFSSFVTRLFRFVY